MPLACPQCKQFYERSGVCPLCNVVLLYHAPSLDSDPGIGSEEDAARGGIGRRAECGARRDGASHVDVPDSGLASVSEQDLIDHGVVGCGA